MATLRDIGNAVLDYQFPWDYADDGAFLTKMTGLLFWSFGLVACGWMLFGVIGQVYSLFTDNTRPPVQSRRIRFLLDTMMAFAVFAAALYVIAYFAIVGF
ncbi:hypothetical protein BB934_22285 [Microvirga ossetica]|uniref:Uncharacterized protein n=2 Tax=Microvirga ossetica TaxID=1882682 RepID=A0A1B2EKW7_9HYPH|nr:hypothetical protein BB934_22285 [Microvirga ossetica]